MNMLDKWVKLPSAWIIANDGLRHFTPTALAANARQTPADVINPLDQQAEKTFRQGFPESVLLSYSKVGVGASTADGCFGVNAVLIL